MTARAGKVSVYLAGKWLDEIVAGTIPSYMALFTSDPQAAGNPLTVELSSGVYSRVPAFWSRTQRIMTNTTSWLWTAIQPGVNISHIGAFDATTNGNFLFSGPVPISASSPSGYYAFAVGGFLQINASAYNVGLDS